MKKEIRPTPHRIVGQDTQQTIGDLKKLRGQIEAEKEEFIAQGRALNRPLT